jgi:hypothetical protein
MIKRNLTNRLVGAARDFSVVTLTGPRQSGKTTLVRSTFPDHAYSNLEAPDARAYALADPRGFLGQFRGGVILDEVQRAPELLSYIQVAVDERPVPGRFVLTGSQNLGLIEAVSQSLAGRTSVLHLLPLSYDEVCRFPEPPDGLLATMRTGGYPRIHDAGVAPADWLSAYTATYVERDVRQILNVVDLAAFQTFVRMLAGRSAQLLNLSALAADCGIAHNTARAWLSVLEAGFLVFRLLPLHQNLTKRMTKSPKVHFHDTGLICYLLGVRTDDELRLHPLRGAVFESWVASEVMKARINRGLRPDLHFYRDQTGLEVDLILDSGTRLVAVEAKSGETVSDDYWKALDAFSRLAKAPIERVVLYGGNQRQTRSRAEVLPWSAIAEFDWGC